MLDSLLKKRDYKQTTLAASFQLPKETKVNKEGETPVHASGLGKAVSKQKRKQYSYRIFNNDKESEYTGGA